MDLVLLRPMELPTKFDTLTSGWSIVYIEGLQVKISKNIIFLSLKIDFVLANSEDPDEMLLLHCSSKYSKTCVKWPLSKRPKIGLKDQLLLNEGQ